MGRKLRRGLRPLFGEGSWVPRPQPRGLCVRWGTSPLPKKGRSRAPLPRIFGPCLLWPNGWMDHDGTCFSPGDFVFDGDPAPPQRRRRSPPIFFSPCLLRPNGCMDQYATWYGGRPWPRRHCVRWGSSSLLPKKGTEPSPQFSAHVYCGQTAGWIKMTLGMEVGLSSGRIVLRWGPSCPPQKSP